MMEFSLSVENSNFKNSNSKKPKNKQKQNLTFCGWTFILCFRLSIPGRITVIFRGPLNPKTLVSWQDSLHCSWSDPVLSYLLAPLFCPCPRTYITDDSQLLSDPGSRWLVWLDWILLLFLWLCPHVQLFTWVLGHTWQALYWPSHLPTLPHLSWTSDTQHHMWILVFAPFGYVSVECSFSTLSHTPCLLHMFLSCLHFCIFPLEVIGVLCGRVLFARFPLRLSVAFTVEVPTIYRNSPFTICVLQIFFLVFLYI